MSFPPLIINAAITGMVSRKSDYPGLPTSPEEIVEEALAVREAGASIVHLHARDDDEEPTYRSEIYGEIIQGIKDNASDLVICVSCSGRVHGAFEQRSEVLNLEGRLKPEMASLTLGSLNFPKGASVNEPRMIEALARKMAEHGIMPELEIFDLGMVDYAKYLIGKGILRTPGYFNLLLGSLGTLSATPHHLNTMVQALPADSTWAATGIGRSQFEMNALAIAMGGHIRVGLEDNLYMDGKKKELATNVSLIRRATRVAEACEREISTPALTHAALGLKPLPKEEVGPVGGASLHESSL